MWAGCVLTWYCVFPISRTGKVERCVRFTMPVIVVVVVVDIAVEAKDGIYRERLVVMVTNGRARTLTFTAGWRWSHCLLDGRMMAEREEVAERRVVTERVLNHDGCITADVGRDEADLQRVVGIRVLTRGVQCPPWGLLSPQRTLSSVVLMLLSRHVN